MKLSIGSNFDPAVLAGIAELPEVTELMASDPKSVVGTDRPPGRLKSADRGALAQYIADAHAMDRTVNFLLNAPSMGGRQFDGTDGKRLIDYVGGLQDAGVDAVTASFPALIQLVKRRFPKLAVHASHNSGVSTVDQARMLEDMGAEVICVVRYMNRNFRFLERVVKSVSVPIQVSCASD